MPDRGKEEPTHEAAFGRERTSLDRGFRFALGHASDPERDFGLGTGYFSYLAKAGFGDGPASPEFDDRAWRLIDLPHDWAVEAPFDARAKASHGFKAVGHGFPERSVGWYRQNFFVPESDLGRRVRIEFDGIYRAAQVFVNGLLVGQEPSGYLGASYDVTEYLNYGAGNVIAVRVDASEEEGWFYEGAGIYRHAWLLKTDPLHIARYGTWVRSELNAGGDATVRVDTTLENEGKKSADYVVERSVLGEDGRVLANAEPVAARLGAGANAVHSVTLRLSAPRLWSLETPVLHKLATVVRRGGLVADRVETPFGIRSAHFDPDKGFFLNGTRVELKGTNNHQDHAGVGVAVPDALLEFRIRRLKEMGSNAYRTSHHPPAPELLDICDRLGMLVIDENRLMGVNEMHMRQLDQMIRRDRNHPSVILWSLGNEEWGIEGDLKGVRITTSMQDYANRLDPTRLTTVALSGWGGSSTVVKAAGVNYIVKKLPDRQHAEFPWQVILGTEETTTNATRGIYFDDRPKAHLAPQENGDSGGNAEIGWKYYAQRPYTAGVFFWTGFDYRGEPTPFDFPAISSQFGILDTCGFPKDGFYYLKSWWGREDVLHVFPHWTWPGREGQTIEVRAHSNLDEIELFVNGASQGRKKMDPNGHLAWQVRYAPGKLLAQGYRSGHLVLTKEIETTGSATALGLQADRTNIRADGTDLAVVTVDLRDQAGRIVPTANQRVNFDLQGPGRIIGVGNGDPSCHEPDQFIDSVRTEELGSWKAPDPAITKGELVFEARFDAPQVATGELLTLLLNPLGPKQSVFLNGKAVYVDADPARARIEVPLMKQNLLANGNMLRIETPSHFAEWHKREALRQVHPAVLRFAKPPERWHRTTFNGLAQVILQSNGEPGPIRITATAPGLAPAGLTVLAKQPGKSSQ